MSGKKVSQRSKGRSTSADTGLLNFLLAVFTGAVMIEYTEFVFNMARDTNGHTADIPSWRVHMGSAFLGSLALIVVLFCLERLRYKSKNLAIWSAVKWLPLVGLTGAATVFHIPILIVLTLTVLYGVWIYRRFQLERRRAD